MIKKHPVNVTTKNLLNGYYNIKVVYNHQIFETQINEEEFTNQFIQINQIGDAIKGNIIDDDLKFKIKYDEIDVGCIKQLIISINMTLVRKNIKEITEMFVITLQKKGDIDTLTSNLLDNSQDKFSSNGINKNILIHNNVNMETLLYDWKGNKNSVSYLAPKVDIKGTNDFVKYMESKTSEDDRHGYEFEYYNKLYLRYISENCDIKNIKILQDESIIINVQLNKQEFYDIDILNRDEIIKHIQNNKDYEILYIWEKNNGANDVKYIVKYYK